MRRKAIAVIQPRSLNEKGVKLIEVMADEINESKNQIRRYIRLTELIPVLLERVDSKRIPFGIGVELSYLNHAEQEVLLQVMDKLAVVPNLAQAGRRDREKLDMVLKARSDENRAVFQSQPVLATNREAGMPDTESRVSDEPQESRRTGENTGQEADAGWFWRTGGKFLLCQECSKLC